MQNVVFTCSCQTTPPQQKTKIKEQTDSQNLVIPQVPSIMHIVFINGPLLDKIHVATL